MHATCDGFVACGRTCVCGEVGAWGDGKQSSSDEALGIGWQRNGIAMLGATIVTIKWQWEQIATTLVWWTIKAWV